MYLDTKNMITCRAMHIHVVLKFLRTENTTSTRAFYRKRFKSTGAISHFRYFIFILNFFIILIPQECYLAQALRYFNFDCRRWHLRPSTDKNRLKFAHHENGKVAPWSQLASPTIDPKSPWNTHTNCTSLISGKIVSSRAREPWKVELCAKILTHRCQPWRWSPRYLPMKLRFGIRQDVSMVR